MEKTTDLPQVTDKLYHIMVYIPHPERKSNHNISGDRPHPNLGNDHVIEVINMKYKNVYKIKYTIYLT